MQAEFIEDLLRDFALAFNRAPSVTADVEETDDFESIHKHSAFACSVGPGAAR